MTFAARRLGVLISGRGSNLQAILAAIAAGQLDAEVAVVIANRADAGGLAIAAGAGVEVLVMPHGQYPDRDAYDRALVAELKRRGVALVCLAGFMRILGSTFCAAFENAVLNIHPSLLPAFAGAHAQRLALEHGAKISGATVHFVTPALDAGPIISQVAVPVDDADTEASLSARILVEEHRLYPATIQRILDGRWQISGSRVVFLPK